MTARYSTLFCAITGTQLLLACLLLIHAETETAAHQPLIRRKAELARTLELSDLCLFTEASYTRHLALADLRTPFQEYPMAMEHFPSGSLTSPPPHLTETHAPHP